VTQSPVHEKIETMANTKAEMRRPRVQPSWNIFEAAAIKYTVSAHRLVIVVYILSPRQLIPQKGRSSGEGA
jgi:hypothetical protein